MILYVINPGACQSCMLPCNTWTRPGNRKKTHNKTHTQKHVAQHQDGECRNLRIVQSSQIIINQANSKAFHAVSLFYGLFLVVYVCVCVCGGGGGGLL